MNPVTRLLVPAAALLLVSFVPPPFQEGGGDAPPAQDAADQEGAKKEKPKARGKVLFEGKLPATKELKVAAAAATGCCPAGEEVSRLDRSLLISEERGIANCVVTVTVKDAKVEVPKEAFELDQKGCRFQPHLQVVPKGAKVAFLNSDETSHNVHLKTVANKAMNQTVMAGKKVEATFEEPERIKVTCDMHPWMGAWVIVTDATHWGVTDEDGAFAIEGLPPGEHEAKVWHEKLGTKKVKIVVGEDGKAEPVEVKLTKKKAKKGRRRR